ncbi:MAG TPA: hypothetical protein V6C78_32570 [Crinalium sp.]|jgi:hypothetical protein
MNVTYRPVLPSDYSGILTLHRENLLINLAPSQRHDGFLSIDTSEQLIAASANNLTGIVAVHEHSVIGFMFGTTVDYNRQFPLIRRMIELYDDTLFKGRSLSSYTSFIYGPVCVAQNYRGTGVLQGLFQAMLSHLAGHYDLGVAFVAADNGRSLKAHTDKLGMAIVKDFEFREKYYKILAFPVPESKHQ